MGWSLSTSLCIFIVLLHIASSQSPDTSDERNDVVFSSKTSNVVVTKKDLSTFLESHSVKSGANVDIQEIISSSFVHQKKVYPLPFNDNGEWRPGLQWRKVELFSASAKYTMNGVELPLPESRIYQMDEENQIVTLSLKRDGDVRTILFTEKGSGRAVELTSIAPKLLVTILPGHYKVKTDKSEDDMDSFKRRLTSTTKSTTAITDSSNQDHSYPHSSSNTLIRGQSHRRLAADREVGIALVFDTSMCEGLGGRANAEDAIATLFAAVAAKYDAGVCLKLNLAWLEGFCDGAPTDPYVDMVQLGKSGCGNAGVLDEFQEFWNENREAITRGTAHLLSGTCLEDAGNGDCRPGCAYQDKICSPDKAYGVNYLLFTQSDNLRAISLTHELGHNLGAKHHGGDDGIMIDDIEEASGGFTSESIASMRETIKEASCVACLGKAKRDKLLRTVVDSGFFG